MLLGNSLHNASPALQEAVPRGPLDFVVTEDDIWRRLRSQQWIAVRGRLGRRRASLGVCTALRLCRGVGREADGRALRRVAPCRGDSDSHPASRLECLRGAGFGENGSVVLLPVLVLGLIL